LKLSAQSSTFTLEESLQLEAEGLAVSYPSNTNLQLVFSDQNMGLDQDEYLIQCPNG
jgi:hypothetical protein